MKRAFEFTDELTHGGTETHRGGRRRETEATTENVLARHLQGDPSRFGHTDGDHRLAEQGKPPQRVTESTGFLFGLFRGRKVVLEVEDGNQKGISFYSKYGFTYEGRTVVKIGGEEIPCLLGELHL